jgi:glycosyltransferase involved in cell wall biosynthesis
MRTPFMLVSDGPQEPTGLGRISRDLAAILQAADLPITFVQVGGEIPPLWHAWPHVPMSEAQRADDWGATYVEALWQDLFGQEPGILWVIWDPSRLLGYARLQIPVQKWTYPAIDSHNRNGVIAGPAAWALSQFDRIIAYSRWSSQILQPIYSPMPYLPHGLTLTTYQDPATAEEQAWVRAQLGPFYRQQQLVGCVATNQPRKDLGLYCQTLAELKARGHQVFGWLHTDVLVKAWNVHQLIDDCALGKAIRVTTGEYTDRQLALLYQACAVTIAPGLGEGFGYPIVESLAAGTPVVHGEFGGGQELLPKREWRFPVREIRLDGHYGLQRPVFRPEDVANAIERVWKWQDQAGRETVRAYLQGTVTHLDWTYLGPRWVEWVKRGLEGR